MSLSEFKQTEIGEIPKDWEVKKIGDNLVNLNSNSIKKNSTINKLDYYDTSAVYQGKFNKPITYDVEDAPSRAKRLAKKGDILISTVRPNQKHYGYLKEVKSKDVFSTGFVVIESLNIDSKYLYYFLTSEIITNLLHQIAESHTSTYPSFKPSDILNLNIPYPSIAEQKVIAKILSNFDSKIELLQKQNKTLKEITKDIFKQWFIDFEFSNNEGESYKSSNGEMVEKESGEIPLGWELSIIKKVCKKSTSGGTPSRNKKEFFDGKINWFKTKELTDSFLLESEEKISEDAVNKSSAKLFPKNSVLMAIYAAPTVGRLGILNKDSTFNQAACGFVVIKEMITKEYLFLYLLAERNNLNNLANGAAQQNLSVDKVNNYPIVIPPKEIMDAFRNVTEKPFDKILTNIKIIKYLQKTKNLLLPQLMSGKIRVPMEVENE